MDFMDSSDFDNYDQSPDIDDFESARMETENPGMKSDMSDDSDEVERIDEMEVKRLEQMLAVNPYDYTTDVLLITKLQEIGELERLRVARENMSTKYPLTPTLWLSWLKDEMKLATDKNDKVKLVDLFERAVKDYLSVDVWLEYLQFAIGSMDNDGSTASVRDLFERALTSAGLHVSKGIIIWEAYREFENVLISITDDETQRKEQINRVGNLFRRQLACPLIDMEKAYEEYNAWRSTDIGKQSTVDDNLVKSGYNRALADLSSRLPYEEKLVSDDSQTELYRSYKTYINYEKQHGDPARVSVLYERAITDLSINEHLWEDYCEYVMSTIKMETVVAPIYQRATRNVPWYGEIWKKWMRSMEKWDKSLLDIQNILENALGISCTCADDYRSMWMAFLEYLRRRISSATKNTEKQCMEILRRSFNRAYEHLTDLFPQHGDPQCVILQFWARSEAIHGNNMEKARSLWADILSQGHSATASSWLEYISLERCYGNTKHLRKLFPKALIAVKDWPESIANAWIDFERDEGTLEQMEFCEMKTKEKLQEVNEERRKAQAQLQIQEVDVTRVQNKKPEKRKFDKEGKWKNLDFTMSKRSRIEKPTNRESVTNISRNDKVKEDKKVSPPPGYKPSLADEKVATSSHDNDDNNEVDHKVTIFLSNLDYTASEEEIRDALKSVGPIIKFKMVKDYKGRSKGFCYVELSSINAVEAALKLDRTPINGRPMFISRCDPNKTTRGTAFKYACDLEKNKLFVKGLPVTTTKEDLENIFKAHGNLKGIRLVTYRNGHSKGLAYVEFDDELSASKALIAADGMTIDDKVISVAISKPPQRKNTSDELQIKSLGGTSVSRNHLGGPKTMLSMVPRSVIKPTITTVKNGTTTNKSESVKSMNNQDFRNMLLNKNK